MESAQYVGDEHLTVILEILLAKAGTAAEKALPYLQEHNPEYYDIFQDTISRPFMVPYTPRNAYTVPGAVRYNHLEYNEYLGDSCFAELVGLTMQNGK